MVEELMGFPIHGLSEALSKFDQTSEQMGNLVASMDRVVELLEEQNKIMREGRVDV